MVSEIYLIVTAYYWYMLLHPVMIYFLQAVLSSVKCSLAITIKPV